MRFLRTAVRLRRLKRRPRAAAALGRVRAGLPLAASLSLNLLAVVILAAGYSSFVLRGVEDGGIGERVVAVELFDRVPNARPAQTPEPPEEEDAEEIDPEEAEVGAEAVSEGVAMKEGEESDDLSGETPPEAEAGQQTVAAKTGAEVPQIALPDVDAAEGRPDGIVGVDCYNLFRGNQDRALECAGRVILSGWRAELANLETDWSRFERELGTERRQIRYGPLRGTPKELEGFATMHVINGIVVPEEVALQYEREVQAIRRRAREREFGRPISGAEKKSRETLERSQDAATYDPLAPTPGQ